jgi:hypothetical protein
MAGTVYRRDRESPSFGPFCERDLHGFLTPVLPADLATLEVQLRCRGRYPAARMLVLVDPRFDGQRRENLGFSSR